MNKQENQDIQELKSLLRTYMSTIDNKINTLNENQSELEKRLDKKEFPVTMEKDILSCMQLSLDKAIKDVLTSYHSPLQKLITEVINENSVELKQIITNSFNHVLKQDEFKKSIISAFSHKVSRSIISNNNGLFDKVSNELKQDRVFRSKMTLCVANIVEECLNNNEAKET